MASVFEVSIGHLHTSAGDLADDAQDLARGCGSAISGVGVAAGSVDGGQLSGALSGFMAELGERGGTLGLAITGASRTVESNAARYVQDDAAARNHLDQQVPL